MVDRSGGLRCLLAGIVPLLALSWNQAALVKRRGFGRRTVVLDVVLTSNGCPWCWGYVGAPVTGEIPAANDVLWVLGVASDKADLGFGRTVLV